MDREQLLTDIDNRKALFGTFFAFHISLQTAGDAFYEEITCKQFFLLICLSLFQNQPPTLNELSEVMGSTHQNVKQIVNKLEENGFLTTYKDQHDKRKTRVVQTEKMIHLGKKYETQENMFMDKFYAGISEEQIADTYEVMKQLERNLKIIREESK